MSSGPEAINTKKAEQSLYEDVTDVYICIFFDGTGNNMYGQLNKGDHLKELTQKAIIENLKENPIIIQYCAVPGLFPIMEKDKYGMNKYFEQRIQAEEDNKIQKKRGSSDSTEVRDNGGLKYSNVAILRSMTKKYRNNNGKLDAGKDDKGKNKIGINYNLYIEGAGSKWDTGTDKVGLGMGTGPTGVVGLVSKAVVFVGDFLHSRIERGLRESVKIHFGIFGFSRGSTCGRLFSYLAARGTKGESLARETEFAQYMPSSEKYYNYKKGRVCLFDTFNNTTVDFLGIYDTVSAIGFLAKDDNSANKGLNQLVPHIIEGKTWYINWMHGQKFGDVFHPNRINEKGLSAGVAINEKGESIESSAKVSVFGKIAKQGSAVLGGLVSMAGYAAGAVMNIPGTIVGAVASKAYFGDAKWNFHRKNVEEYGLFSHTLSNVKHTFHICAMDEFRENFALVDLGLELGDHCTEVFMPGCHSDIGGGIMKDESIAKMTLRTKIGGKPTVMITNPDPRLFDDTKRVDTSRNNHETKENDTNTLLEQNLIETGWLQNTKDYEHFITTKVSAYEAYSNMAYGASLALNGLVSGFGGYIHPSLDSGPPTPDSISNVIDGFNRTKDSVKKAKDISQRAEVITSNIQNSSEGIKVYYKKLEDKIEFKRFAMEGYSNITLEMMFKRAICPNVGLRKEGWPDRFLPFGGQSTMSKLPARFQITKTHKGSLGYYKACLMKNYNQAKEKSRQFLIPPKSDYKELRKNYLHFSCTDELNVEQTIEKGYHDKDLWTVVGANLGNPPNWKQRENDFLLCRIIYRGDKNDDNLHYMDEYLPTK